MLFVQPSLRFELHSVFAEQSLITVQSPRVHRELDAGREIVTIDLQALRWGYSGEGQAVYRKEAHTLVYDSLQVLYRLGQM